MHTAGSASVRALLAVFERLKNQRLADPLQLLPGAQLPRLKVHVIPSQASRLAEAQTAGQCHAEHRAEAMAPGDLEERCCLLHIERRDRTPFGVGTFRAPRR